MWTQYQDKDLLEYYNNHPLFEDCISIYFPKGWDVLLKEILQYVELCNRRTDLGIKFVQVKVKYNLLVVYVSPSAPINDDKNLYNQMSDISQKIDAMTEKSFRMCKVCGKDLVKTVVNSKITTRCLDHFDVDQGHKNFRRIRL